MVAEHPTFVKVFEEDGFVLVVLEDAPRVDAAVSMWVDSGGTRDTLLELTRCDGDGYWVKASTITSWTISTYEGRRRSFEWEAAMRGEEQSLREAAGLWESGA